MEGEEDGREEERRNWMTDFVNKERMEVEKRGGGRRRQGEGEGEEK